METPEPPSMTGVDAPSGAGAPQGRPAGAAPKRGLPPALWVLLTLAVGIGAGLVAAAVSPQPFVGPGTGPRLYWPRFETHSDIDVVLSTVGVALLVALLAVYVRTYRQTNANFALGLVFVLLALLVQSLVSSPVLIGAFGRPLGELGTFFLVADVFKSFAFSVFLYLSLQ